MISQREARKFKRRVKELEGLIQAQRNGYRKDWPDGVNIATFTVDAATHAAITTARKLSHGVVVTSDFRSHELYFMALPISDKEETA